jgi:dTDP-glucose 4,6-dehydratase
LETLLRNEKPRTIVHFAAETHVDRSIQDARPFIETNIIGTQNLVDLARQYNVEKFLYISTDEVYGESRSGRFHEGLPLRPGNPYAATKAAAEFLARAAVRTHRFPAVIIRPANNYGHWQYPEKFVPVIILKAMHNQKVPVYGEGRQIREWLHVSDCAQGIFTVLEKGAIGEIYNIGSYFEQPNIETARTILRYLGKSADLIEFVEDRPGHDFRYSVDCAKIRRLGWRPATSFRDGMRQTVEWYREHSPWVETKAEFLKSYWKKVYKPRRKSR